jgi:hypothetical protein
LQRTAGYLAVRRCEILSLPLSLNKCKCKQINVNT